jgi:hypothetical protein
MAKIWLALMLLPLMISAKMNAQDSRTGKASANGTCNQAASGNNNKFVINCYVDARQGKQMVILLNTILQQQVSIDEILKGIQTQNKTLLSYSSPTSGELVPGNATEPPDECSMPDGGYKVFIGGSVAWNRVCP